MKSVRLWAAACIHREYHAAGEDGADWEAFDSAAEPGRPRKSGPTTLPPPPSTAPKTSAEDTARPANGAPAAAGGSFPAFQMLQGPITATRAIAKPAQLGRTAPDPQQACQRPFSAAAAPQQPPRPATAGGPQPVQHGALPAPDATVRTHVIQQVVEFPIIVH